MRKTLKILLTALVLLLIAELAFVGYMLTRKPEQSVQVPSTAETAPQTTAAPETTEAPTTVPPTTLPPEPESFTLTFTGDFTPGCRPGQENDPKSYVGTVGENYEFPFANLREIFSADDFTFINLEVVLGNAGRAANKTFVFRGPEEYVQIMTSSSVEAVTLANNHVEDFGAEGYANTKRILEENGVAYVEEDKTALFVTETGLTIGLYADSFDFKESDIEENIAALREEGAEIIICAFHWGTEGAYRHNDKQERYARFAIDAGADIVVGNHPHVLQEMEEYNGKIIFYSLGNFSFGGNKNPSDYDSAVIQLQILREYDGAVRFGDLTVIPIRISSDPNRNNYQPILYTQEDEGYQRVLDKLSGAYTGANVVPGYDYSKE